MNVEDLITELKVYKKNSDKILANGQLTLCEKFKTKFAIFKGKNGPFVSWPCEKDANGHFAKDKNGYSIQTCGPVDKESADAFNKIILAEYENPTYNSSQNTNTPNSAF